MIVKYKRYTVFALVTVLALLSLLLAAVFSTWWLIASFVFVPLLVLGLYDLLQLRHAILRNYPIVGHLRFLLETFRPEIRQYVVEADQDEVPFSREQRALVYQRAKGVEDKHPFGTIEHVYDGGYSWMTHSAVPTEVNAQDFRIRVGGPDCKQPYDISLYNISAMSFGALGKQAIRALNKGAKMGGFAHDTGEGSISRYHREMGGDLIYQIASGYFGCRNDDGTFAPEKFAKQAADPQVKMIEIKLSQGAKPGHGGMLPASKISPEIAEARHIPMGIDCISPAGHSAFRTPIELMEFIGQLRELSNGKPIGFKLCIGHRREFLSMCKAMIKTGIKPDFIVVDGAEGGTGAAPIEFANRVGMPMLEGLSFVQNALRGAGVREDIRVGVAGKIITAFDIARAMALGADFCNSARGFMFALGCIQARICHTNLCPTGITTQDLLRQRALDVEDKSHRVMRFHRNTMHALAEIAGAAGLKDPNDFRPYHFMFRKNDGSFEDGNVAYPYLPHGFLLLEGDEELPGLEGWYDRWDRASADSFDPPKIALGPFVSRRRKAMQQASTQHAL